MGDIALSACTVNHWTDPAGFVHLWIETAETVDAADVITPITLADYGMKSLTCCRGYVQTTTDDIVTREDVTTSVTSGVLSVTIPSGTNDDIRVIEVIGRS